MKTQPTHTPTPLDVQNFLNQHKVAFSKKEMREFIVRAVKSHEELLRLLKAMTDQIDKHFYSLPEQNENDGKYWKRLYDSACEAIAQAEGK